LATSSEDGVVRVWNAADGTPLTLLQGHTDTINYVHFHPFYNLLLTGSDDGTARAWDLGRLKETTKEGPTPLLPLAPDALPPPCVFPHTPPGAVGAAAGGGGGGGGGEGEGEGGGGGGGGGGRERERYAGTSAHVRMQVHSHSHAL